MTVKEAYLTLQQLLKERNIEFYQKESKLLLEHILGKDFSQIIIDYPKEFSKESQELLKELAKKRCSGYPLQYIIGKWNFFGNDFFVGEGVLIPRQDTETLCEAALKFLETKEAPAVMDLCAGSGAIAVTLEKNSKGGRFYALEKFPKAFEYLTKNIKALNSHVTPILADALEYNSKPCEFDLIVSNPPYLTKEDMENLQTEVSFEPKTALDGKTEDGLYFYRELVSRWKNSLKPGGAMMFEIGINQHNQVEEIMMQNNLINICKIADMCGIIRVIAGYKK